MIYSFQDNIVKNKPNKPYAKWFELAKKSKNRTNKKSDFDELKKNKVMAEVLRRLEKTKLEPYEFKYVSDLYQYEIMLEETKREAKQDAVRAHQDAVRQTERAERAEKAKKEEKERAERAEKAVKAEKERAERAEKAVKAEKENTLKSVRGFLMLGKDVPDIAGILDLPIEEIYSLVQQIQKK
jgi:ATPase subunit of ABC transporter with duplicated ATPase domains